MEKQPLLPKAKKAAQKSGLTYQEIGVRMGYAPESARQSVGQFLNSTNPSVRMLLKFAKAIGVEPGRLL